MTVSSGAKPAVALREVRHQQQVDIAEHSGRWLLDRGQTDLNRAVGASCLTLIIGRFSMDYRELRFKNTIIPLPYPSLTSSSPIGCFSWPAAHSALT